MIDGGTQCVREGLRLLSRPFLVFACLLGAARAAYAQDPMRPWLDWRTIATRNYRFHYPRELEAWTRASAARVESIDSAIVSIVGFAPPRPVHVVVDDPYSVANGYALPFLDAPVSVWWVTPPDPRNDVGNFRTWGEMLATHELTHIAHLTRPSRNPFQRQLWASLPANLGPIARKAPRWVYEGYATYVEGRISGTGRPHNVWRPAVLRQWAIEGRLPTYGQLSSWGDYNGGAFAYLGGSALFEWLARRDGDSTIVQLWRRMTARTVRSFNASFAGLYGDSPAALYGRMSAEITRDAMAARSELERAGLVQGALVQHLFWGTGDPAVSPNGERIAISVGEIDRPSSVVIWNSAPEQEDTATIRKRIEAQKRDPQDVPDRRFYPVRKKALKTLRASQGRSFGQPRWLADNRRVLVTRWALRGDGTLRPDLYVWDPDSDVVHRVTHGAGIVDADPSPRSATALATRCRAGQCDVVSVDLTRRRLATVLAGDTSRSYYRPRYSRDGRRFAVSVAENGRWRVLVGDADGHNVAYADPDDDANRYDATWTATGDTLIVVSERGGIPNLESISLETGRTRTLTRVTGAAVAPEVNRADGSVWFLSMHSRGFDLRRLPPNGARADSVVTISTEQFGFAGAGHAQPRVPPAGPVAAPKAYGPGPRDQRWVPGFFYSADGGGAFVSVFTGDIVGRLNATVTAAGGEDGTVRGASLRATWRYPRPALEGGLHAFMHQPSLAHRYVQPLSDSLDAGVLQSIVAASLARQGEGWYTRARIGIAAGTIDPTLGPTHVRRLEFAELAVHLRQLTGASGLTERMRVHATQGRTRADYVRIVTSAEVHTVGRDALPLELGATIGKISGRPHPFDNFTVGGAMSPVGDSSLFSQRYAFPIFPTAIATGRALFAWRAALPMSSWTLFYSGASTADDVDKIRKWNRAIGAEMRYSLPPVPAAFSPRIESRGGIGYTLDDPFRHRIRVYLEMRVDP